MSEDVQEILKEQIKIEAEKLGLTKEEKIEVKEEPVKEVKTEDPFLEEALKQGYNPDYKGADKKTAEQFVKDGSFYRKIEAQNKKIDQLIEFNKKAMEHAQKVEKLAYEKALKDLQLAKIEAVKEADVEKVLAIESQVSSMTVPEIAPVKTEPALPKCVEEFKTRNPWVEGTSPEDIKMQAFVESQILYEQKINPGLSAEDAISTIEARVQREFPHRFENENKKNAPLTVSDKGNSSSEKDSDSLASRLSSQQRDFIRKARRDYGSAMTDEQYAKQLLMTGDLND